MFSGLCITITNTEIFMRKSGNDGRTIDKRRTGPFSGAVSDAFILPIEKVI
jgi:hypothetical protein